MSIHILTQDPKAREQLVTLMEELGQECTVHTEVEPVEKAVKKLGKADAVFYDLTLEDILWAFERLYIGCRKTNLIGFELLTQETVDSGQHCPDGMEHYLLLPPNANRAKERVHEVLKSIAQKAAKKPARKKAKSKAPARKKASKVPFPVAATAPPLTPNVELTIARYLHAQSMPMQSFLAELHATAGTEAIVLFEGEDGTEFELAARELNFHTNGDIHPLYVLDPAQIKLKELKELSASAQEANQTFYCYIGETSELTAQAAEQLLSYLKELHSSNLRLIAGKAHGSEAYTTDGAKLAIKKLSQQGKALQIPPMSERAADVPLIAQRIFSTLRIAHPFLVTRTLTQDAVSHLQTSCDELDYSQLTRLIRNAMALGVRETLTANELKNFNANSPTTHHLIESLADEKFFNQSGGGVA